MLMNNKTKEQLGKIKPSILSMAKEIALSLSNRELTDQITDRRQEIQRLARVGPLARKCMSLKPVQGLGDVKKVELEPTVYIRGLIEITGDKSVRIMKYKLCLLDNDGKEIIIYPPLRELRGTEESKDQDIQIIRGHIGETQKVTAYEITETFKIGSLPTQKVEAFDNSEYEDLIKYSLGLDKPNWKNDINILGCKPMKLKK